MKNTYNFSKYLLVLMVLLLAGCFEERKQNWDLELLEWMPPDRSTNALSMNIELEAEESGSRFVSLQIQYAGAHRTDDATAAFVVDEENSDAIEGTHFEFVNDSKTVVIPAGDNFSEEIEIEILAGAFDRGDELGVVLLITNDGDIPPMENYREFNLLISKETGYLTITEFRLDRPGFLADLNIVDAATGMVYSKSDANSDPGIQEVIDFGLWNSSGTEFTIIVPTDDVRLNGWGSGRTVRDEWVNRNDGVLFKLPSSPDNQELFEKVLLEDDLIDAYNEAEQELAALGLDADDYGPGGHLQYVSTGELIFFHSISRNFHAILFVDEATSGGSGYADFSMKNTVEE